MEDSKNKLDDLLDSGNVEKAMQMAFSVLSAANGASGTASSVSNHCSIHKYPIGNAIYAITMT